MLLSAWHLKFEVLTSSLALLAAYPLLARPLSLWRTLSWVSGVLLLALSLVSPLDTLAHDYLFSAHMAQHLLMTIVVPPLLLLGIPPELVQRTVASRWRFGGLLRLLGNPLAAWVLATGVLWVWHAPVLYGAALRSDVIHILQHAMFLSTALLFWWPVVAPISGHARMEAWGLIAYLFAAMAAGSALGILLAFAPVGLYPHYLNPQDHHGLLGLVRDGWGISPADDQQLGGMLMWIPGGIVYGLAIVGTLALWLNEPDEGVQAEEQTKVPTQAVAPATAAQPAAQDVVLSATGELRVVGERSERAEREDG